jgi:hypothetical protein
MGRVVNGLVELGLHAWDVDTFRERENFPYHAKLCVEGIPHHAWGIGIVEKILSDEVVIVHVEEESERKKYERSFDCWVVCKDL